MMNTLNYREEGMRRMTKKLLRIVSPLLVLALTLSVVSVRAGEGEVPEVVCAPVAAAAPAAKAETMPSAPADRCIANGSPGTTASRQGSKSAQFEQAVTAIGLLPIPIPRWLPVRLCQRPCLRVSQRHERSRRHSCGNGRGVARVFRDIYRQQRRVSRDADGDVLR